MNHLCESNSTCICSGRYQLRSGGCSPNQQALKENPAAFAAVHCCTSGTSLLDSGFPHEFCLTSSYSTPVNEWVVNWMEMWRPAGRLCGLPQGCGMQACSVALRFRECLHRSSSKTGLDCKIRAPVLAVPIGWGSGCHAVTVGLLSACSVHVEAESGADG